MPQSKSTKSAPKPKKQPTTPHPKPAPQKPTATAPITQPPDDIESAAGLALARTYRATLPSPTPPQVRAFTNQCSDSSADSLGIVTRSELVQGEAQRWSYFLNQALTTYASSVTGYSKARFAFYLDSLFALADQRAKEAVIARTRSAARAGGTQAHNAALEVRDDLLTRLEATVEGRDSEGATVDRARGTSKDDGATVRSILGLVDVAKDLLEGDDEDLRTLAAEFGLDQALLDRATKAAAKLDQAKGASGEAGPLRPKDSPEVNRLEGRVLFEMRVAMRQLERAHDANHVVPRLIPGVGTRRVLAPSRIPAKAVAPAPVPADPTAHPAPSAPNGTGSAQP